MKILFTYNRFNYVPVSAINNGALYILHGVYRPDGSHAIADFDTTATMSEYQFQTWIELGLPKRISSQALSDDDLRRLVVTRAILGKKC